jgi:hypothetical protein
VPLPTADKVDSASAGTKARADKARIGPDGKPSPRAKSENKRLRDAHALFGAAFN